MPVVAHKTAQEIPWRRGYRVFNIAGPPQGVTCAAGISILEPGAGAPLHAHRSMDEVLIVVEGTLDLRIGDERRLVEANHTIVIPAGTPHGFTAVGTTPVRMYTFIPQSGAIADATTYFEGGPPEGAQQH